MRKLEKFVGWMIVAACSALFVAMFVPTLFPYRPVRTHGLSNVKQLGTAILIYASDHDDRLPQSENWMTQVRPHVRHISVFRMPKADGYGTAFLMGVGGRLASEIEAPSEQMSVFESTLSGWNATSYFDTAFSRVDSPKVLVAFFDASARRVSTAEFDRFGRPVSEPGLPRYLAGGGVIKRGKSP